MGCFTQITNGRESWGANHRIQRHRHDLAYAAVVLSGGYEECGSQGRFRVAAGDVLLHSTFDAHLNRFQRQGAQILNLVIADFAPSFALGHIGDLDIIARAAERDPIEAAALLRERFRETNREPEDWPDILARDLLSDPHCRLDSWARKRGLAAETLSRGFNKVFDVTPAFFRMETRARRAFALITASEVSLASIAAATGFADQAHMSRTMRALTGATPRAWRRSNLFKTGPANLV
ncbi:MAG: AraC family transcriptional regulator [Rhizomicrobium sp.]